MYLLVFFFLLLPLTEMTIHRVVNMHREFGRRNNAAPDSVGRSDGECLGTQTATSDESRGSIHLQPSAALAAKRHASTSHSTPTSDVAWRPGQQHGSTGSTGLVAAKSAATKQAAATKGSS